MENADKRTPLPIALVTADCENDLLTALVSRYGTLGQYVSLSAALDAAEGGGIRGIMLMADGYPERKTEVTPEEAARLTALGIRLYIEYPKTCEALGIVGYDGEADMGYSRAVTQASADFGLEMNSILYAHGARYCKKQGDAAAWLVAATVAGYDVASFGLDGTPTDTLLEVGGGGRTLIAATALSRFIRARYTPYGRWCAVFNGILSWVSGEQVTDFAYTPAVTPSLSPDAPLAENAYRTAVQRNSDWYLHSGILKAADGSEGIYEGFSSGDRFDAYGRQEKRTLLRADCNGESVGALALAGRLLGDARYTEVARNAMCWLLCESPLSQGERADPESPQYGLLSWHDGAYDQYYGDDNAKAVIGLLLAASALGTDRFDRRILEVIVANFRTTGPLGFRDSRVLGADLEAKGWRHYYEARTVYYSAHFEALPWATYLFAYDKTGYRPFLTRTECAIGMMMQAYENTLSRDVTDKAAQWRWANGMQQERAKMILPLAWLLRISPTDTHARWLDRMVTDLMKHRDPATGALADAFGDPDEGNGLYGPFTENAQYGRHESPVIQENGDPCSDSLYTASFAMVTLIEAAAAMEAAGRADDALRYRGFARSLADYHVRIQQVSRDPIYDGVWFRGFDFRKWETYGSDGDAGWGVFCIETGWSQAWISAALSLAEMGTNVWDYTRNTRMGRHGGTVIAAMLGKEEEKQNEGS